MTRRDVKVWCEGLGSRQVVHVGVTRAPSSTWVARSAANCPISERPKLAGGDRPSNPWTASTAQRQDTARSGTARPAPSSPFKMTSG
jgi:hypothetical protein